MNDRLVEDYRSVITNKIFANPVIVDILKRGDSSISNDVLLWKNILPQRYVPFTITDAETQLMYDISEEVRYVQDSSNGAYVSVSLYFWLYTHKHSAKYKEKLVNDTIAFELKRTFNGDKSLGIAPTRLIYDKNFDPRLAEYSGRELLFFTRDWGEKIRLRNEQ